MSYMNELETSMLNDIKSLITMFSLPGKYMPKEIEFELHKNIEVLEYKLVTQMSYRACGNNIDKRLVYLKSMESEMYGIMRSYPNLSDTYNEVDRIELIYRCRAIRQALSQREQEKIKCEQEKIKKEQEANFRKEQIRREKEEEELKSEESRKTVIQIVVLFILLGIFLAFFLYISL